MAASVAVVDNEVCKRRAGGFGEVPGEDAVVTLREQLKGTPRPKGTWGTTRQSLAMRGGPTPWKKMAERDGLAPVDTNSREKVRVKKDSEPLLQWVAGVWERCKAHNVSSAMFGNVDEMPLR